MGAGVVHQPHVHVLEDHIMAKPVFLQCFGVHHHYLQVPHHQHQPQNVLITLELPVQHFGQVGLIAERPPMRGSQIRHPIRCPESRPHVLEHFLPVINRSIDDLVQKVSVGIIWQFLTLVFISIDPTLMYL